MKAFSFWCDPCIVSSTMQLDTFWGKAAAVAIAVQMAVVTAPSAAWAQATLHGDADVQPVPYPTAPPPVPYGAAPPPVAAGQSVQRTPVVGQDVITMKNGGILRGTIIDAIPDAQARIQLATGEIATVPWAAIDRIEHGNAPPRPAAPLPPLPGPTPAPPASFPGTAPPSATVFVHVEGPDGVLLEADRADNGTWVTECQAPCDIALPVSSSYRIAGHTVKQSGVFRLHGQQGDHVTVNVTGGSKAWLVVGIVITPVAGVVTLTGLLMGLVGSVGRAAASYSGCYGGTTCAAASASTNGSLATTGWITALVGAAATVGGIVLIANNAKTGVSVDLTGAQAARVQGDAWAHVPSWREATAADKAAPPVFGGSLWSGRF
jgi:hypothetical protein